MIPLRLRRVCIDARRLLRYAGVALLAIVAVGMLGDLDVFPDLWFPQALIAASLIGLGVLLLNVEEDSAPAVTPTPARAQVEAGSVPTDDAPTTAVVRSRRERSPLGWLGLGTALLLVSSALIVNRDESVFVDASARRWALHPGTGRLGLDRDVVG